MSFKSVAVSKRYPSIGARLFAIGDSNVQNAYSNQGVFTNNVITAHTPFLWTALLSQGQIYHAGVSATIGFTSSQILATHVPVAIAAQPDFCCVLAGTNDAPQIANGTITLAQTIQNLTSIYTLIRANGIMPVAMTIPPRNNTTTQILLAISNINEFISRYARQNNIPLIDTHSILVDPSSNVGAWNPAYLLADGNFVHWNEAGAKVVAQQMITRLTPLVIATTTWLPDWNADTSLLQPNQLMLTDSNADGVPDNWTVSAGTGYTPSLPAAVSPGLGKLMTFQRASNDVSVQFSLGIGLTALHRYLVAFRLSTTVEASGGYAGYRLINTGGAQIFFKINNWPKDIPANSVYSTEFVAPTGLSDYTSYLVMSAGLASGAIAQMGQFAYLDLTSLGIA